MEKTDKRYKQCVGELYAAKILINGSTLRKNRCKAYGTIPLAPTFFFKFLILLIEGRVYTVLLL